MTQTKKPRAETKKEMQGITRDQFHGLLKRAIKPSPSKPSPK
jgi:hypothetical protein